MHPRRHIHHHTVVHIIMHQLSAEMHAHLLQTTQLFSHLTYQILLIYTQQKCLPMWKHTPTNKSVSLSRDSCLARPKERRNPEPDFAWFAKCLECLLLQGLREGDRVIHFYHLSRLITALEQHLNTHIQK